MLEASVAASYDLLIFNGPPCPTPNDIDVYACLDCEEATRVQFDEDPPVCWGCGCPGDSLVFLATEPARNWPGVAA